MPKSWALFPALFEKLGIISAIQQKAGHYQPKNLKSWIGKKRKAGHFLGVNRPKNAQLYNKVKNYAQLFWQNSKNCPTFQNFPIKMPSLFVLEYKNGQLLNPKKKICPTFDIGKTKNAQLFDQA